MDELERHLFYPELQILKPCIRSRQYSFPHYSKARNFNLKALLYRANSKVNIVYSRIFSSAKSTRVARKSRPPPFVTTSKLRPSLKPKAGRKGGDVDGMLYRSCWSCVEVLMWSSVNHSTLCEPGPLDHERTKAFNACCNILSFGFLLMSISSNIASSELLCRIRL